MRTQYTNEDIEFLRKYYPIGDWETIFKRFPNLDKKKIYSVCSKRDISANYYERDKSLKSEYYRSAVANRKRWTNEEVQILQDNYAIMPVAELMKLLPNRTYDSAKAEKT